MNENRKYASLKFSRGFKPKAPRMYEDYAYVLDFLPYGRPSREGFKPISFPVAQVLGEKYFTLLEVKLKPGTEVRTREKIYIGKEDKRDKVERVLGKLSYEELTGIAKSELLATIEEIVKAQEQKFVAFFNNAQPVTPRMHALELLPSIGKKSMWQIINEREKKPFQNFKDLQERTGLPNPAKILAKKILEELSGEPKYRLFTRPP